MPRKQKTSGEKTIATSKKNLGPAKQEDPRKTETTSGLTQEAEDQFELELCWCIQQLEQSLANIKLQDKQAYDLGKNINVLKSNSAPLVKKRQIMRNTLGNYREKMALDEQKLSKAASSVKFNSSAPNKKYTFLRKAAGPLIQEQQNTNDNTVQKSIMSKSGVSDDCDIQNAFKFNFQLSE